MRILHVGIGSLVAVAVLLAPISGSAQALTDSPTTADLQQQVTKLRQSLAQTNRTVGQHSTQMQQVTVLLDSLVSKIDAQESTLADQSGQIESLKIGMDRVTTDLRKQIGDQEAILNQISKRGADGSHSLTLLSAMDRSLEFKNEMRQAVNLSIGGTGTLEVENLMDVGKYFKVNGRESYIPARSTKSFTVPSGTLTTELVGDEPLRSFTVGPPSYTQRIEISPKRVERTVQRPVTQFSTVERVYVDSPYYYVNPPITLWP